MIQIFTILCFLAALVWLAVAALVPARWQQGIAWAGFALVLARFVVALVGSAP